ncbi:MAG: outer membrane lipid asymmetry maintenance protein MlaD [Deltaproteobacteria bacterium]|nr:outer membrane lipid asymmetry maintenance protein MlaD [Deltaproteobacteria bacterium]
MGTEKSYTRTEVAVGAFVMAGVAALAYLSASIGGMKLFFNDSTEIKARFASVGALKEGASVKIAGVRVGQVKQIVLDDYAADTRLQVDPRVALPSDTIASIRTEGLLGESYVLLRPGGSEKDLAPGDRIGQTEPAIDLIDLVVKYALEKDDEKTTDNPTDKKPGSADALPDDLFGD